MSTETRASIADLYEVEGKAELVHGEIVAMPPAGDEPGRASLKVAASLLYYEQQAGRGRAYADGTGFHVNLPHREAFSPDAAYHVGPPTGQCQQLKEMLECPPCRHRVFLVIGPLVRDLASRANRNQAAFPPLWQSLREGLKSSLPQQQEHQLLLQSPHRQLGRDARAVGRLRKSMLAPLGVLLGEFRFQLPWDQPPDGSGQERRMDILLHREGGCPGTMLHGKTILQDLVMSFTPAPFVRALLNIARRTWRWLP